MLRTVDSPQLKNGSQENHFLATDGRGKIYAARTGDQRAAGTVHCSRWFRGSPSARRLLLLSLFNTQGHR
jgi:hypothetical protein